MAKRISLVPLLGIAIVLFVSCFGLTDDSAEQSYIEKLKSMQAAKANADAQQKADIQKYHFRVPTNDAEQKSLNAACAKGSGAFFTWIAGSQYVKDKAIPDAWEKSPGENMDPQVPCKMTQIAVAYDLKKYSGKTAGIDYLKASDPEAANSIAAQERAEARSNPAP